MIAAELYTAKSNIIIQFKNRLKKETEILLRKICVAKYRIVSHVWTKLGYYLNKTDILNYLAVSTSAKLCVPVNMIGDAKRMHSNVA